MEPNDLNQCLKTCALSLCPPHPQFHSFIALGTVSCWRKYGFTEKQETNCGCQDQVLKLIIMLWHKLNTSLCGFGIFCVKLVLLLLPPMKSWCDNQAAMLKSILCSLII